MSWWSLVGGMLYVVVTVGLYYVLSCCPMIYGTAQHLTGVREAVANGAKKEKKMIRDPENYTGLFVWELFVTIEHRYPNGDRETTMITRKQYERSGIQPALTALPTLEGFKRGTWIERGAWGSVQQFLSA